MHPKTNPKAALESFFIHERHDFKSSYSRLGPRWPLEVSQKTSIMQKRKKNNPNCCNLGNEHSVSWGFRPQKQQFHPPPETNHQLLLWRSSSAFICDYPRLLLLFSWRGDIPELFWSHPTAGPIMAPPSCACTERRSGHQLCFCLSVGGDIFTITGATFQRNKEDICLTEGGTVGSVVLS